MSSHKGLLVDYEFCTGCAACEQACMNAEGHGPESLGIKVVKLGPWKGPNGQWQFEFFPFPTDFCDMCKPRQDQGKRPHCERHCTFGAIQFGEVSDLSELLEFKSKAMLFSR